MNAIRQWWRDSWVTLLTTFVAIVLALLVGAVFIVFSNDYVLSSLKDFGSHPWTFFNRGGTAVMDSYLALVRGSLGGPDALGTTLERSAPLICAGLGVTLAFRAGLFNIGAQGQLIAGAICAGYVGFNWDLPAGLHLLVALIAGLLGGALWGAIVGVIKASTGAHEVILTIMFNYLALSVLDYLLSKDSFQRPGSDNRQSPAVDGAAQFPQIGDLHTGVVLAFVATLGVWWVLERSKVGFEMRAVGANAAAARTAGMSNGSSTVLAMTLAGLLAGLAATMTVLGQGNSLSLNTGGTIGFDAITVALLGRASPLGTLFAGLLFGALSVGGSTMQAQVGTSDDLASVLQALIVLFVAAPALVRAIIRLKASGGEAAVLAKGWG